MVLVRAIVPLQVRLTQPPAATAARKAASVGVFTTLVEPPPFVTTSSATELVAAPYRFVATTE